ncbi:hypothetical protein [Chryseobacterium joostei]|uniref:hypothetical protein n=1 Tax=Chryseobacterium joostei TaxID=112234 RepID=UPI0023F44E2B|nr:hypothetical protein [Chryseobacterium joostei]
MKPKEIFGFPNTLGEGLMLINNWKRYCGESFADFKLFASEGKMVERYPLIGDYIKIDVLQPGVAEAKGFDWVQITYLFEKHTHGICLDFVKMTCRHSPLPPTRQINLVSILYSNLKNRKYESDLERSNRFWVGKYTNQAVLGQ